MLLLCCFSMIALFSVSFLLLPLAYLDPVTGSFILQAIIGFVLGGWYLIKRYYNRIRSFFRDQFSTDSDYEQ